MKVVNLKQNSKIWLDWRGKGLGASDAPYIMGSPYKTAFRLWAEKTKLLPKEPMNIYAQAATERGKRLEPEAREKYEQLTGNLMAPISGEHDEYAFIRASLDGIDPTLSHFVEIKCPGIDAHEKAKKGQVPEYYRAQVQQQFLVSGCKTADYFSYRPEDETPGAIIPLKPEPEYQAMLLVRLIEFWQLVQTKTPPRITHKEMVKLEEAIEKAKTALADAERAFELAKKALQ